uniref:Uncharacterized protein n=1 Tax=Sus scrofa TaxID=9823 RepID=A0A480I365_PIG
MELFTAIYWSCFTRSYFERRSSPIRFPLHCFAPVIPRLTISKHLERLSFRVCKTGAKRLTAVKSQNQAQRLARCRRSKHAGRGLDCYLLLGSPAPAPGAVDRV